MACQPSAWARPSSTSPRSGSTSASIRPSKAAHACKSAWLRTGEGARRQSHRPSGQAGAARASQGGSAGTGQGTCRQIVQAPQAKCLLTCRHAVFGRMDSEYSDTIKVRRSACLGARPRFGLLALPTALASWPTLPSGPSADRASLDAASLLPEQPCRAFAHEVVAACYRRQGLAANRKVEATCNAMGRGNGTPRLVFVLFRAARDLRRSPVSPERLAPRRSHSQAV